MKDQYIKLDNIIVEKNRIEYCFTVSDKLRKFINYKNNMFLEFDEDIQAIPKSILAIPFVSNFIPLMWLTNSTLWIKDIDRTYYDSLKRVKVAYQDMYPHYKFYGNLITGKTTNNIYNVEREAVQLFSGGLDAISTNIRIDDKKPILINVYGWYKDKITSDKVFNSDKKNIGCFAKENNLDSKFIKSNFATIIKASEVDKVYKRKLKDSWWHGLQHGMAFIGHAIPLAYKYKVKDIYISSSFPLGGIRKTCSSDPVVDIEIKYASGGVIHDGCELNRQDKIKLVVKKQKDINKNYPLRVCSFNDINCCKCEKCFRTILGLIAEGADIKKFDFNIDTDIKEHFSTLMKEKIHLFGVERENNIHWPDIKKRMIENEKNIIEQDFVKWFLNYDFIKNKKKAVIKYRIKNFIPLVKKRLMGE